MHLPHFFRLLFSLLLGLSLWTLQSQTSPLQAQHLTDDLVVRDAFHTSGNAVEGPNAPGLRKRAVPDIVVAFNSVTSPANKVGVGGTKYWVLDIKNSARFTTSEFYGCTIVVIASGGNVVIGHYGEVAGACVVLEDKDKVATNIIRPLEENLAFCDFDEDDTTHAWVIHSSEETNKNVGYGMITGSLGKFAVPKANIKERVYPRSSGTGEFPGVPKGKLVVDWESKNDGALATLTVLIESNTAAFTQDYDCNGPV